MTEFYIAAVLTAAVVLVFALWPIIRSRKSVLAGSLGIVTLAIGFSIYQLSSNFDPARPLTVANEVEQIRALEARTRAKPDSADAWSQLAHGYMQMELFSQAVNAYQRAYDLTSPRRHPELLLDYAEALAAVDEGNLAGSAGQLIEDALKLDPNNLRALWYGGSVAASRGNRELAAKRFESMLRDDTPPNIRQILEANIVAMRNPGGEIDGNSADEASDSPSQTLEVNVDIADSLRSNYPSTAVFYLIATTDAGGPPLGVVRLPVAAIPGVIEIGDKDAMLPGRNISGQKQIKLVARISMAGQPVAASGDLFGELTVQLPSSEALAIDIAQLVP